MFPSDGQLKKKLDTKTMESLPSSNRIMRNLAEKQRRDKLNSYINELSTLVQTIASAPRKLDKTSILRISANHLRLHQCIEMEPAKNSSSEKAAKFCRMVLQSMDAFQLIISTSGKIIYVCDRVESILGHHKVDMLGLPIYCFAHKEDHSTIRRHLSGWHSQAAASRNRDCQFECRLAGRSLARGEPTVYERVLIYGTFRAPRRHSDIVERKMKSPGNQSNGRASDHDMTDGKHRVPATNGCEAMLFAVAKVIHPQPISPLLTVMESTKDEYITRHLADGTIIQADHRIGIIAGYLPTEVTGLSAYNYIYKEDFRVTLQAQRLMLANVGGESKVTYRLVTKAGNLIYLRSQGFIEFDATKKEVTGFVCINTLLDEENGEKELKEVSALVASLNASQIFPQLPSLGNGSSEQGDHSPQYGNSESSRLDASPSDGEVIPSCQLSPHFSSVTSSRHIPISVTETSPASKSTSPPNFPLSPCNSSISSCEERMMGKTSNDLSSPSNKFSPPLHGDESIDATVYINRASLSGSKTSTIDSGCRSPFDDDCRGPSLFRETSSNGVVGYRITDSVTVSANYHSSLSPDYNLTTVSSPSIIENHVMTSNHGKFYDNSYFNNWSHESIWSNIIPSQENTRTVPFPVFSSHESAGCYTVSCVEGGIGHFTGALPANTGTSSA